MANNREQQRLDQLAAKAGINRKQFVVREFFRLGKVRWTKRPDALPTGSVFATEKRVKYQR